MIHGHVNWLSTYPPTPPHPPHLIMVRYIYWSKNETANIQRKIFLKDLGVAQDFCTVVYKYQKHRYIRDQQ